MHKLFPWAAALILWTTLDSGCAAERSQSPQNCFENLPAAADPKFVGQKVSANFLPRKIYTTPTGTLSIRKSARRSARCGLRTAAGDTPLEEKLVARYAFHFDTGRQQIHFHEPARGFSRFRRAAAGNFPAERRRSVISISACTWRTTNGSIRGPTAWRRKRAGGWTTVL